MASIQVHKTETSEKKLKQPQNGAQVTVLNQTPQVMTFVKSIEWSGSPASPGYPKTIQPNSPGMFTHISNANFGSKAAVVYSGTNLSMQACAWVLAWYAPAESKQSPNKVYLACGSKSLIDTMTDDQIRMALDNSSQAANASDPSTKTSAYATINDLIPFMATVGAGFSLLP